MIYCKRLKLRFKFSLNLFGCICYLLHSSQNSFSHCNLQIICDNSNFQPTNRVKTVTQDQRQRIVSHYPLKSNSTHTEYFFIHRPVYLTQSTLFRHKLSPMTITLEYTYYICFLHYYSYSSNSVPRLKDTTVASRPLAAHRGCNSSQAPQNRRVFSWICM